MGRSLRQDAFVSTQDWRALQQSQGGGLATASPSCGRQDAYRPHSQDGCATFFRDRAGLEFRRGKTFLRFAIANQLQSRANSLPPDEQDDHAGPNQWSAWEFAGRPRLNRNHLDTDAAATFGIGPSPRGVGYIGFTEINGQLLPLLLCKASRPEA
jgi:hypothetical protein